MRQAAALLTLAVLAGLSLVTQANHHVGHARGHLDEASYNRNLAYQHLSNWRATLGERTAAEERQVENLFRQLQFVEDFIVDALEILEDPALEPADLFEARAKVNQPQNIVPGKGSALRRAFQVPYAAVNLAYLSDASNHEFWRAGMIALFRLWQELDRAAWHIGDAIFEMVYGDLEFAE